MMRVGAAFACGWAFVGLVLATATATSAQVLRDGVRLGYEGRAGRVSFVAGAALGEPIRGRGGAVLRSAGEFLTARAELFGVRDVGAELMPGRVRVDNLGWRTTEFAQVHRGVPVFTGELRVHQNAAGEVMVANGDFHEVPARLSTTPVVGVGEAREIARGLLGAGAEIESAELVVVDRAWYGDRSTGVHLAWHVVVRDRSVPAREAVFVDAHRGFVIDSWSMLNFARDREIYDGEGTSTVPGPTLARGEGDAATGDADIDAAYDYYGDTYDYFFRAFGRDGIDDAGLTMVATVHSTAPPCPNAYWDGEQMVFCDGTVTDDIVAHELTHGVTEYTANLVYQNQSGALNESFSDVFGEMVDLFNGDAAFLVPDGQPAWPTHSTGPGQDTPNTLRTACSPAMAYPDGVRWLLGEDADSFGGALRDMWDPTCEDDDPGENNSEENRCQSSDNGGVHISSGIPNHAFAILVDGDTYNGVTVSGIGPIKAGAVWYRALATYLTRGSDFQDAYWALNQAAEDLIGTTPNDPRTGAAYAGASAVFTAGDAAEVGKALRAVEMHEMGPCGAETDVFLWTFDPDCTGFPVLYNEDFEGAALGWTVSNSVPGGMAYDWALLSDTPADPLPYGRGGTVYWVDDTISTANDETGTHTLMGPSIALGMGVTSPVLKFDHFVELHRQWDGGSVSLRVNGGSWQKLSSEDFWLNGYNSYLYSGVVGNTSPRAGEAAFTGYGSRWGTSVVDLSGYASGGDTIQFRFDLDKNGGYGFRGWYVDDVMLLEVASPADCNGNGVPDFVDAREAGDDDGAVWSRGPTTGWAFRSDADPRPSGTDPLVQATRVHLMAGVTVERVRVWGIYLDDATPMADDFTVVIHEPNASDLYPGAVEHTESGVSVTRTAVSGAFVSGYQLYEYELTLMTPAALPAGIHFVQVRNDTAGSDATFYWVTSDYWFETFSTLESATVPPVSWSVSENVNNGREIRAQMAMELLAAPVPPGAPVLYVDEDGPSDGDGLSWATALDSLGEALEIAAANCVVEEVRVASGSYWPDEGSGDRDATFSLVRDVRVLGGWDAGSGLRTGGLTILSGDIGTASDTSDNSHHVVTALGTTGALVDGFMIAFGNATDAPANSGGGARIGSGAVVSFVDCTFFENQAVFGGGAANIGGRAAFSLCNFSGNTASNGGAVDSFAGAWSRFENCSLQQNTTSNAGGALSVFGVGTCAWAENCDFSANVATGSGGGVFVWGGAVMDMRSCVFSSCRGLRGGAVALQDSGRVSMSVSVVGCVATFEGGGLHCRDGLMEAWGGSIRNCTAEGGAGGGALCELAGTLRLMDCEVYSNDALTSGGGVGCRDGGLGLKDCSIHDNTAVVGGGGVHTLRTALQMVGSELYGNEGERAGAVEVSDGSASVTSCTIHGNSATGAGSNDTGGVLLIDGSDGALINTIAWGNVSASGLVGVESSQVLASGDAPASSVSVGTSLVEGWSGSLPGLGTSGRDPRFVDAAMDDLRLGAGSPAIDRADADAPVMGATLFRSPSDRVVTGLEIEVPLAEIGWDGGPIRVCAFINGVSSLFVSNQVTGGLDPTSAEGRGVNFGGVPFDWSAVAGDQFVEITGFESVADVLVDGVADECEWGEPVWHNGDVFAGPRTVNPTGFGDNTDGTVLWADGSELCAVRGFRTADTLHLHIAGALETNTNRLEVFIDCDASGPNMELIEASHAALDEDLATMEGSRFDAGFGPDYYVQFNRGACGPDFCQYLDACDLVSAKVFAGGDPADGVVLVVAGPGGGGDVVAALDNSNDRGVTGAFGTTLDATERYIDAANYADVGVGEAFGGRVPDMGAYEADAATPAGCVGDMDGDLDTDVFDFNIFAPAFGTSLGDPGFVAEADLDWNGTVDVFDFNAFAPDFGCMP